MIAMVPWSMQYFISDEFEDIAGFQSQMIGNFIQYRPK